MKKNENYKRGQVWFILFLVTKRLSFLLLSPASRDSTFVDACDVGDARRHELQTGDVNVGQTLKDFRHRRALGPVFVKRFCCYYLDMKTNWNFNLMGGSPGLVVMGGDSCSKGRGFESRRRILDGHDTLICCETCVVCLKRPKINEGGAEVGPIFKKTLTWFNVSKLQYKLMGMKLAFVE